MHQEGVVEHTGFPNPATDKNINSLDISKLIIKHPSSTFFMQIDTNAWENLSIFKDDLAVIDRAISPRKQDLIVYWNNGYFTLKKFKDAPKNITIWGVISNIIHRYRK